MRFISSKECKAKGDEEFINLDHIAKICKEVDLDIVRNKPEFYIVFESTTSETYYWIYSDGELRDSVFKEILK